MLAIASDYIPMLMTVYVQVGPGLEENAKLSRQIACSTAASE